MDSTHDLIIENGTLWGYSGPGGVVTVPEGVYALGENVFRDCVSLTGIILPLSLKVISKGAFWGCIRLEQVILPPHMEELGPWAFFGCSALREIVFPLGLRIIGTGAFQGCRSLTDVKLPGSMPSLGISAFDGCSSLRRVVFSSGTEQVCAGAFRACTSLESIKMPTIRKIGERSFWGCSALRSIVFPDTLETIGDDAFYYCTSLSTVSFPESLREIGQSAFYGCAALAELAAPDCAMDIGRSAFAKTRWLDSHEDGCVYIGKALYQYKGVVPEEGTVTVHNGTELIAGYAFCDCPGLRGIDLPSGLRQIGESSFEGCSFLSEIVLPDGLESIGKNAFRNDTGLRSISFPGSAVIIGDGAFRRCRSLRQILLPESLKYIGKGVFSGCSVLEKLYISERSAFFDTVDGVLFTKNGRELCLYPEGKPEKTWHVPDGTERIMSDAFAGVAKLRVLYLPSSLDSLLPGTFTDAPFEYIRLPRSIRRLPADVFAQNTAVACYYPDLAERLPVPVYLGGPIEHISPRRRTDALLGFLVASGLGDEAVVPWRSSYVEYIRRNEVACGRLAAENEPLLHLMIEEGLLSLRSADALLGGLIGADRTDLTAALLSYKQKQFPQRRNDLFSLDDTSPEMQRLTDTAQKRDRLLQRIGIEGLLITAAGRLRKFGYYSPAGVVDMSDLRSFIRKHGGEYRSSLSSDTDCLICNDPARSSIRVREAAELGIPVITEEEFLHIVSEDPRRSGIFG